MTNLIIALALIPLIFFAIQFSVQIVESFTEGNNKDKVTGALILFYIMGILLLIHLGLF